MIHFFFLFANMIHFFNFFLDKQGYDVPCHFIVHEMVQVQWSMSLCACFRADNDLTILCDIIMSFHMFHGIS